MRVSDLIRAIYLSTSQTQDTSLSDATWLALSQRAFPRRDLIGWYDGITGPPAPISRYFVGLIAAFTYAMARSGQVNRVVSIERDGKFFPQLQHHLGGKHNFKCWSTTNQGLPNLLQEVPLHQIALSVGLFEELDESEIAQIFMSNNYYNSAQLYFFSGIVYKAWKNTILSVVGPTEVYRGPIHGPGEREYCLIFRDQPNRLAKKQG